MENIIALIGGLVLGGLGGYFSVRTIFKSKSANAKSDITLKEAELTAKRKIDEAEIQAEKTLLPRPSKPMKTSSSKKFGRQRDKFNQLKSEFESYKAEQKVAMKDREMQVLSAEKT